MYAVRDVVWEGDKLRQDIHDAVRVAYIDKLPAALAAKAEEIEEYLCALLPK